MTTEATTLEDVYPWPWVDAYQSMGPFVVTRHDPSRGRSVVAAGPYDDLREALDRAARPARKYPLMVDKAAAFPALRDRENRDEG